MAKDEIKKNPLTLKFRASDTRSEQEISLPLEIYSPSQRRKIVDKLLKNKFEI